METRWWQMGGLGEETGRREGKDGNQEKWMDSGYVLEVELKELADRLTLECK